MAKKEIETLLQNYERAKVWREGVVVVLAGVVNAGKSSLLNAFLGKERAIVTPCPGTTRDYLEENILLGGLLVRLVDTAGLRKTEDDIEAIGLAKGKDRIQNADLVLLVFDCTQPIGEEERLLCEQLPRERIIAVSNKQDKIPAPDVEKPLSEAGIEIVPVSARTGEGLDKLGNAVRQRVVGGKSGPEDGQVVPNKRQEQALRSALQEIKALEEGLDSSVPYDLLGVQLEMVCTHLSEITGEITSQQVLDAIFSQFCIGK